MGGGAHNKKSNMVVRFGTFSTKVAGAYFTFLSFYQFKSMKGIAFLDQTYVILTQSMIKTYWRFHHEIIIYKG